jgi:hypothetical protein
MKKNNILILISLFAFFSCSSEKDFLPEEFSGLKLKQKLTGDEAKNLLMSCTFRRLLLIKMK